MMRVKLIIHPNGVEELRAVGIYCRTVTRFLWRFRPEGGFDCLVGYKWKRFIPVRNAPEWWNLTGWLQFRIKR